MRAGERRRYWFQLVANLGFAAAWVMVAVLSGAWVFVVLAVLCAGMAVLAGGCLVVLRRRTDREHHDRNRVSGPTPERPELGR